LTFNSTYCCSQ